MIAWFKVWNEEYKAIAPPRSTWWVSLLLPEAQIAANSALSRNCVSQPAAVYPERFVQKNIEIWFQSLENKMLKEQFLE